METFQTVAQLAPSWYLHHHPLHLYHHHHHHLTATTIVSCLIHPLWDIWSPQWRWLWLLTMSHKIAKEKNMPGPKKYFWYFGNCKKTSTTFAICHNFNRSCIFWQQLTPTPRKLVSTRVTSFKSRQYRGCSDKTRLWLELGLTKTNTNPSKLHKIDKRGLRPDGNLWNWLHMSKQWEWEVRMSRQQDTKCIWFLCDFYVFEYFLNHFRIQKHFKDQTIFFAVWILAFLPVLIFRNIFSEEIHTIPAESKWIWWPHQDAQTSKVILFCV